MLCQQPLLADGQKRLVEFENYVKGELEGLAIAAEVEYQAAVTGLPGIPTEESLKMACQAAGLVNEKWFQSLLSFWSTANFLKERLKDPSIRADKDITQSITDDADRTVLVSSFWAYGAFLEQQLKDPSVKIAVPASKEMCWIESLQQQSEALEVQAKQHDLDAQSFDQAKVIQDRTELLSRKWISQQSEEIKVEVERLKQVAKYDTWIKGTDHTTISRKAGDVSKEILTNAYVQRFNNELEALGAKQIKVELVKSRAELGKPLHVIKLRGMTQKLPSPLDILSDGEKRIVGLAAFLADVTGRAGKSPFIFDDPISSLDQEFEEKTIDRLIELSKDRQVIVFTHRLSFLGIICDKVNHPDVVCIRQEPWGSGEPVDTPLFSNKPKQVLNKLLNERLKQAENVWNSDGSEAYYPHGKSICSDLRILVERMVEYVLLADVVSRHRRAINTKGKIQNLAKIQATDCTLIDDFMSNYSRFEHSQSQEAPVDIPPPASIRSDINRLVEWHDEYEQRAVKAST